MKRAGIVAIAVPALTVGTVALVSAYQANNDFQPFNTDREYRRIRLSFLTMRKRQASRTAAGRRKRILEKKYRFHKGQESCFGITEWEISV